MVKISGNAVQTLKWKLWISRRGTCQFDLEDFKQVQQTPHIELHAIDGSACKLMVWQDPRRVTLAHARCENHCTPGSTTRRGRCCSTRKAALARRVR